MNTAFIDSFDINSCRAALSSFWTSISDIRQHDKGIAFSLPVLLADGWQVTLYAEEEIPGHITLRDRGRMSSWLYTRGVNIQSSVNRGIVERFMSEYGVTADSTGFNKTLKLPLDPAEIQLFGCFLSAVSHLVNRVQKQAPARYVAYSTVINVANQLEMPHKPRVAYTTPHRTITVDLSLYGQNERTALVQTFDQRDPHTATDSMELWSTRLTEIADSAPQLYATALIYNEDVCDISPEVLAVAKSRVDFVCPSHRSDEISDFFTRELAC